MMHVWGPHFRKRNFRFYHTFELPDGRKFKGEDDTGNHFLRLQQVLPDVKDKTVIDIGAWDGWYSFKMEEIGAKSVLATDYFCWNGPGWGSKDVFDLMRTLLKSQVKDKIIDPANIRPDTVGMFDVVLFLGILYHRPDCFQAFANAASVSKEWLIMETIIDHSLQNDRPLFSFYPFDELYKDHTNWFTPNICAVESMYAACGFEKPRMVLAHFDKPHHNNSSCVRGTFASKRFA